MHNLSFGIAAGRKAVKYISLIFQKRRIDMIKRKFSIMMAVAMALVIMMFTGSAFAQGVGVSIETGAIENAGDTVLFTYYDIRTTAQGGPGLSDNYFTVVNTDGDEWMQAHVRVRTGQCSVELLDFDVLLSPRDVFTFDLYQGSTGATVFASCDEKTLVASNFNVDDAGCYVLDSDTFPNMLSLISECGNCPDGSGAPLSLEQALDATRFGYVEVIGEVELEPCTLGAECNDECLESQLEAGDYIAWTWVDDGCNWSNPGQNLFGRVYYAKFDANRDVAALSVQNGFSLNNAVTGAYDGAIIPRRCYSH